MKRLLFIVPLLVVMLSISYICFANPKSNDNPIIKSYSDLLPFWDNMYNCNSYSYTDWAGRIHKIVGKEGSYCHVKFINTKMSYYEQDCYFPIDVAKKYANLQRTYYKDTINSLQTNSKTVISTDDSALQQKYAYDKQYCKMVTKN